MLSDNRVKTPYAAYTASEVNAIGCAITTQSYYLATDTAKFFVAKWDSETGDAYCRFLIECEKVVIELQKQALPPPATELVSFAAIRATLDLAEATHKRVTEVSLRLEEAMVNGQEVLLDYPMTVAQQLEIEKRIAQIIRLSDGATGGKVCRILKHRYLKTTSANVQYYRIAQKDVPSCIRDLDLFLSFGAELIPRVRAEAAKTY